jgi:hypothetical protein
MSEAEAKTELPLLAKVELGLIQGNKAIEGLCEEVRRLEGRLEAIQQHYQKLIIPNGLGEESFKRLNVWALELGVLLEKAQPKFRCDEFGNPNRSDACDQCPSNSECFEEEKRRRTQPKARVRKNVKSEMR